MYILGIPMSLPLKRPHPFTGELPRELEELSKLCRKILNNKKIIDFLWTHTESDRDFRIITDAMFKLVNIQQWLCVWLPESK
jgi:hypothetical protein